MGTIVRACHICGASTRSANEYICEECKDVIKRLKISYKTLDDYFGEKRNNSPEEENGNNVRKYRKKPVIIEAIKWTGENHREMFDFLTNYQMVNDPITTYGENFYINHERVTGGLIIKTLEGEHLASIGDYIIKGVQGEFYPCKPDIFEETYELVGE